MLETDRLPINFGDAAHDAPSRNFNDGNPAGPARRSTYDALGRESCDGNSDFTIVLYDPNSAAAYDGNSAANTEAQRHAIEAWAAANGIEVILWQLEEGISGTSEMEERPSV